MPGFFQRLCDRISRFEACSALSEFGDDQTSNGLLQSVTLAFEAACDRPPNARCARSPTLPCGPLSSWPRCSLQTWLVRARERHLLSMLLQSRHPLLASVWSAPTQHMRLLCSTFNSGFRGSDPHQRPQSAHACHKSVQAEMSIGIEKGPPIGVQKGPLCDGVAGPMRRSFHIAQPCRASGSPGVTRGS